MLVALTTPLVPLLWCCGDDDSLNNAVPFVWLPDAVSLKKEANESSASVALAVASSVVS